MDKRLYVELPPFTGRNVPITEIAKAIGKDAHYVRIGIQQRIEYFSSSKRKRNCKAGCRTVRIKNK